MGLYVMDALTGAQKYFLEIPAGYTAGNRGLGGVVGVRDINRRLVAAYAGDALGNLWRFDLRSSGTVTTVTTATTNNGVGYDRCHQNSACRGAGHWQRDHGHHNRGGDQRAHAQGVLWQAAVHIAYCAAHICCTNVAGAPWRRRNHLSQGRQIAVRRHRGGGHRHFA
jgi:hypothetical protein